MNRQHARSEPITRIVPTVDGDRVVVDHVLPDTRAGRDAAAEVRSGLFRGLSVETAVRADRHVAGRREITAADLVGVGLVDSAAFAGSTVTVHERQRQRTAACMALTLGRSGASRDRERTAESERP